MINATNENKEEVSVCYNAVSTRCFTFNSLSVLIFAFIIDLIIIVSSFIFEFLLLQVTPQILKNLSTKAEEA